MVKQEIKLTEELKTERKNLRDRVIKSLLDQGFKINENGFLDPGNDKETYKKIFQITRIEQLKLKKDFLIKNIKLAKYYCQNGNKIDPNKITLELREIKQGSLEDTLLKWWNLIWWSMTYQSIIGRLLKFMIWDTAHNSPFGIIILSSPIINLKVRDSYLEIPRNKLSYWINKSMNAQRLGALPPYNQLLGGKMVAMSVTSNEIRKTYREKYENYITKNKKIKLGGDLLFITTMSAFGRSSIYNRLKYKNEIVAKSLGYTSGFGVFHISEEIFKDLIKFLEKTGYDVKSKYTFSNHGPHKLEIISAGLNRLGLSKFLIHNIKREVFLIPLVKNLKEIIIHKEKPIYIERPFYDIVEFWKERWAIPRAERKPEWKNFNKEEFFNKTEELLYNL